MATPVSPKTRLFIKSAKIEEVITAGEYWTAKSKSSKLDEGIVKGFFYSIRSGEDVSVDDLETPASKKAGKALIVEMKKDIKASLENKDLYEKAEELAKVARKQEKEDEKVAIEKDKKESGEMLAISLSDEQLIAVRSQLTESSIATIKEKLSDKFSFDENGIITVDPNSIPTKQEFADAFASVNVMVDAGTTVKDSAGKVEAQIGYLAKTNMGEAWVNLFSARPEDLPRIMKGVKVFETVAQMKSKSAKKLFSAIPFDTSRALIEMKITTAAEQNNDKDKAAEINFDAKKEVYLRAAELQAEKTASGSGKITQAEAKNIVKEYKQSKGIGPVERMHYIHIAILDKAAHIFGTVDLVKDNVRLSMFSFDMKGNRLAMSADGNNVVTLPLNEPDAITVKYLLENATPPEMTKEEKAAKALADKEAAKAAAKGKKKGSKKEEADDEQEEDETATPIGKSAPAVAVEEDDEGDDDNGVSSSDPDEEDGDDGDNNTAVDEDDE